MSSPNFWSRRPGRSRPRRVSGGGREQSCRPGRIRPGRAMVPYPLHRPVCREPGINPLASAPLAGSPPSPGRRPEDGSAGNAAPVFPLRRRGRMSYHPSCCLEKTPSLTREIPPLPLSHFTIKQIFCPDIFVNSSIIASRANFFIALLSVGRYNDKTRQVLRRLPWPICSLSTAFWGLSLFWLWLL